jgi:hypothetical protein
MRLEFAEKSGNWMRSHARTGGVVDIKHDYLEDGKSWYCEVKLL